MNVTATTIERRRIIVLGSFMAYGCGRSSTGRLGFVPNDGCRSWFGGHRCRKAQERLWRTYMCLGIPGQIVAIVDDANSIAKVDVSGVKRNVNIALVRPDGIGPGDWVLIHVGFAMSKIDEHEAQETIRVLQHMGEVYTDELKLLHASEIE